MLDRILNNFNTNSLRAVIAYGSAIFPQTTKIPSNKNVFDFIIVVDDSYTWHHQNIEQNKKHYSSLALKLGCKRIVKLQEQYGAGIYYNSLIPFEDKIIKYGVISTKVLFDDLLDWDYLYTSGRLHKPVRFLYKRPDKQSIKFEDAINTNLKSAIHVSLLQLPQEFTEFDFYQSIANLSYCGDFRMKFGENPKKVFNIVSSNMQLFREMYKPLLLSFCDHVHWDGLSAYIKQSKSCASNLYHLNLLPKALMYALVHSYKQLVDRRHKDTEEVLRYFSRDSQICDEVISHQLRRIVGASSLKQSIKGILTAGPIKSVKYISTKIQKMISREENINV